MSAAVIRAQGRRRHGRRSVALAMLVVLLASCSGATSGTGGGERTVVATTTILGDVARQLVGDEAQLITLMPAGTDPHAYRPSARELAELVDADLVVVNGGNLEESLTDALDEAAASGVEIFVAADHTSTLPLGAGSGDGPAAAHSEENGAGSIDPHIWMDPVRMAQVTRALGATLERVFDEASFQRRADAYAEQLEASSARFDERLRTIPAARRFLVTNHDSLAYFADRYDFQIVGTIIPSVSTGAEPSAQDLERLARTIRRHDVGAVFAETTAPVRLAQALAVEAGLPIDVVSLYTGSLSAEGAEAASYLDLLETDVARIADALGRPGSKGAR